MELLLIVQIIFYAVFSLAIILSTVLSLIMVYNFIKIGKHLRHISENLDNASSEVKENLESLIGKIVALPILSIFLKKFFKKVAKSQKNK